MTMHRHFDHSKSLSEMTPDELQAEKTYRDLRWGRLSQSATAATIILGKY